MAGVFLHVMDEPSPPLLFESLEIRRLFAGMLLSHHVLQVNGNPTFDNIITVGLTPGGTSVGTQIIVIDRTKVTTINKTFPLSAGIREISIRGGNGDDVITVDQTYGSFPIKAYILGGAGDDTITGGDENDTIFGGSGDDSVVGGNGNNVLYGGKGNDTLIGGAGNDYLNGGPGEDSLVGGLGNDTLVDFEGPDKMYGGPGRNVFYLPSLQEDRQNDFNKTTDVLHLYTPPSTAAGSSFSILNLIPVFNL
jgi:Ca2+-binding RTX toxin-like protein